MKLLGAFKELGFTPTKSDTSLFKRITTKSRVYALVYVDDIITGDSASEINNVISLLNDRFALKDLGKIHYFLEIQVTRTNDGGLLLSQGKYLNDVLQKGGMQGCKSQATPLPSTLKLTAKGGSTFEDPKLYRSVVGSLQYLTVIRPEIAYCVNRTVVAHSSTEAEYRSIAVAITDIMWIQNLLTELACPLSTIPQVYCDNLNAILLVANPILHSKLKHFKLDLHFIQDYVEKKSIHVPERLLSSKLYKKFGQVQAYHAFDVNLFWWPFVRLGHQFELEYFQLFTLP
ncbi:uncharacterized protein LOC107621379 [Arachis ipaensis]|uniref:uncharacterized protein LOC107621379 n=1 Tax=Arachis ipaensis TaxID=130454 RepID=UPI0007AF33C7|nr:uncharacterized protein LOC107621379 [Arachis ipaensis]